MALQVWLPFIDGTLTNNGFKSLTLTSNNTSVQNNGKLGKCLSFNGSSSIITSTEKVNIIGDTSYTIAFWMYWAGDTWTNDYVGIVGWGQMSTNQGAWAIIHNGKPDLDFWNRRYEATTQLQVKRWYHITMVKTPGDMSTTSKLYVDGQEVSGIPSSTETPSIVDGTLLVGRLNNSSTRWFNGYLNDIRIYDEALSPFEIKRIAQGLILHYPLNDNSIQQMNNCYNYPTFNTSTASGGWYHWGSSGHAGNYGQTTDKNYIYRSGQTYAHWVSDGEEGTYNYLVYQSPAFEGGYRSLQAIIKSEDGSPITEAICYPAWNARDGGAISNKWTSIIPLRDNFYLCKCEGIHQDGSNDLVGIYVHIGKKIYISEAYLENDREICSDIFSLDTNIYDCSGYCNNGIIMGTLNVSTDTPRYNISTYFPNTTTTTTFDDKCWITAPFILNNINQLTVSFWFKKEAITRGGLFTTNVATYTGTDLTVDDYDNSVKIRASDGTSVTLGSYDNLIPASTWCHWVVTFDGINIKVYVNGILKNTVSYSTTKMLKNITNITLGANKAGGVYRTAKGNYSDFRIYATALSADDVKALYENSAYIATDRTSYAYEYVEA